MKVIGIILLSESEVWSVLFLHLSWQIMTFYAAFLAKDKQNFQLLLLCD